MSKLPEWLCMMPFASAEELGEVMPVSRATVNRVLGCLYEEGWAVSRKVGRRLPAKRRWFPTSEGIREAYAFDHIVHDPTVDDHDHDPLFSDECDHRHLPWWLGEGGIRELYQRLEQLEAIYELAPTLFLGEGRRWLAGGHEARLERLRFLRRGQLVEAVGTYEEGIEVAFCWVGKQLRPRRMVEKWRHRFSHPHLVGESEAAAREAARDHLLEQQDPDFDPSPHLAGYVCIGPDEWAVRQAMDRLPLEGYSGEYAWSWWVAGRRMRRLGQTGLVLPNRDRIADRFEVIRPGEPERVAPPTGGRDAPPEPAALSRVLCNRIVGLAEEFDALIEEDFVDLAKDFRGPVQRALADLVNQGLLAQVEEIYYYLADPGMRYVTDRDRVAVSAARSRVAAYLNPDLVRHHQQLAHNRGVIEVVRLLKASGIRVYGGWRGVVNIPGHTQVQPDGVMYADGPLGRGVYRLEFERTATTPEEVLQKRRPYRRAGRAGVHLRCVWVCETRQAAQRFLRASRGLPAMVATLADLRAGPLLGPDAVWRSTLGQEPGQDRGLRPYADA